MLRGGPLRDLAHHAPPRLGEARIVRVGRLRSRVSFGAQGCTGVRWSGRRSGSSTQCSDAPARNGLSSAGGRTSSRDHGHAPWITDTREARFPFELVARELCGASAEPNYTGRRRSAGRPEILDLAFHRIRRRVAAAALACRSYAYAVKSDESASANGAAALRSLSAPRTRITGGPRRRGRTRSSCRPSA